MWAEPQTNGKIKYCERYTDPLTMKQKKVSVTLDGKDTISNRKKAIAILQDKIDKATAYSSDSVTLSQLLDKYYEYQKLTLKASTYERNYRVLYNLVCTFGKDAIVNNLTSLYINEKLLGINCTNVTRNEYIKRFKAMLTWGERMDLHDNYRLISKLVPFKEETSRKERTKDKYLEPEELDALLQYMADGNNWMWYHLTKFLVLSGVRVGEALALDLDDIDTEYIHITKTYDTINKVITTTKTETSTRDVYIQDELDASLTSYKAYRKELMRERSVCTNHLFFSPKTGGYVNYASYCKYLREASEKLGHKISPHALRHTSASLLATGGISIDTVQRRLGHESSRITKEIYTHVTQGIIEQDNAIMKHKKIL